MRVLVLSGGGSKGAFQLGVLSRLMFDNEFEGYDAFFGVSTGALSASILAQGSGPQWQRQRLRELIEIYNGLEGNRSIYTGGGNILSKLWGLWQHGGVYNINPLRSLVARHVMPLGSDEPYLGIGYTDLCSGEYVPVAGTDPRLVEKVIASATQPIFFQMLDQPWCDGGVRNMTPLAQAFRYLHAHPSSTTPQMDVILCEPEAPLARTSVEFRSAEQVASRTLDILLNDIFVNDIRTAMLRNEHPNNGDVVVDLLSYAPDSDLGDGLDFSAEHLARMFQEGAMS